MIPVVDGHHHIWRQADLPWLVGPMQPRIFGPYEPIRRDYPIERISRRSRRLRRRQVGLCADQLAARTIRGRGRLGAADGGHDRLAARDRRLCRFRPPTTCARSSTGFRATPSCAARACNFTGTRTRNTASPSRRDLAADPAIRRNVGRLADYGLSFDLQVFAPQMADAADLAESCPKVIFVLQHAGMLEDLTPAGRAEWRAGMVRLSACGNVVSKLSGLGTFLHRNDPAHVAEIVRETVGVFGPGRCLFGSNFPIEKLWTSYAALIEAYRDAVAALPAKEQQAVLHDTAMSVYRIAP